MMCFRCEHRARHLEALAKKEHYQPRCECGDITSSKVGCYMFRPCHPLVTEPAQGDKRPRFGPAMIACREYVTRILDPQKDNIRLDVIFKKGKEIALSWVVVDTKKKPEKKDERKPRVKKVPDPVQGN
jgi:hypothetical protein